MRLFVPLIILLLILVSCKSSIVTIKLDEPFLLRENQTAIYNEIEITQKNIIYSPCPENALCVWSGLGAGILVKNTELGDSKEIFMEQGSEEKIFNYRIVLEKVEPKQITLMLK